MNTSLASKQQKNKQINLPKNNNQVSNIMERELNIFSGTSSFMTNSASRPSGRETRQPDLTFKSANGVFERTSINKSNSQGKRDHISDSPTSTITQTSIKEILSKGDNNPYQIPQTPNGRINQNTPKMTGLYPQNKTFRPEQTDSRSSTNSPMIPHTNSGTDREFKRLSFQNQAEKNNLIEPFGDEITNTYRKNQVMTSDFSRSEINERTNIYSQSNRAGLGEQHISHEKQEDVRLDLDNTDSRFNNKMNKSDYIDFFHNLSVHIKDQNLKYLAERLVTDLSESTQQYPIFDKESLLDISSPSSIVDEKFRSSCQAQLDDLQYKNSLFNQHHNDQDLLKIFLGADGVEKRERILLQPIITDGTSAPILIDGNKKFSCGELGILNPEHGTLKIPIILVKKSGINVVCDLEKRIINYTDIYKLLKCSSITSLYIDLLY